jgi:hypothetical protein
VNVLRAFRHFKYTSVDLYHRASSSKSVTGQRSRTTSGLRNNTKSLHAYAINAPISATPSVIERQHGRTNARRRFAGRRNRPYTHHSRGAASDSDPSRSAHRVATGFAVSAHSSTRLSTNTHTCARCARLVAQLTTSQRTSAGTHTTNTARQPHARILEPACHTTLAGGDEALGDE